jgi:hypothetical protein
VNTELREEVLICVGQGRWNFSDRVRGLADATVRGRIIKLPSLQCPYDEIFAIDHE